MLEDWEERVVSATIELEREENRIPKLPSKRKKKDFGGFLTTEGDNFVPQEPMSYEDFVL